MKLELSEKQITIFTIVCILSVGGFIYWLVNGNADKRLREQELCTGIEVKLEQNEETELQLTNSKYVEELIKSFGIIDSTVNQSQIDSLEKSLLEIGLFNKIEIYKVNTNLCFELSIKTPFFLVQSNDGESYYVVRERVQNTAQEGNLLESNKQQYILSTNTIPYNSNYKALLLPIITGSISKEYAVTQGYDLLLTLEKDSYFKDYFAHIYMDKDRGLILRPKNCNTDIIFGYATNWQEMLHKLRIFEEEVIQRKGWDKFEYLKFNFQNQVIAKAKK